MIHCTPLCNEAAAPLWPIAADTNHVVGPRPEAVKGFPVPERTFSVLATKRYY